MRRRLFAVDEERERILLDDQLLDSPRRERLVHLVIRVAGPRAGIDDGEGAGAVASDGAQEGVVVVDRETQPAAVRLPDASLGEEVGEEVVACATAELNRRARRCPKSSRSGRSAQGVGSGARPGAIRSGVSAAT